MALSAARVTVTDTAVALNATDTGGQQLVITNLDATNGVDLGASDVAADAGYPLAASETVTVDVDPGDALFAVRSTVNDVVLSILRT